MNVDAKATKSSGMQFTQGEILVIPLLEMILDDLRLQKRIVNDGHYFEDTVFKSG